MRASVLVLACTLALGCGARTGLAAGLGESCDGEDDDGDGRIDEGVAAIVCGEGACRNEIAGCIDGRVPACEPRPGVEERCNGVDDDCDGRTDEALGFGPIAGPFEVALEPRGVFTTDLVASGGGMVAVWNVGFDGSHPPPTNAFSRRLDADGHAVSEAQPILERPVTMGLSVAPSPRGLVLTYCGRFGFQDLAASAFLDAEGAPLGGEVVRGDGTRSCGAVRQSGIHTGVRHLFAWTTNGGTSMDGTYPVFLDVADDLGRTLSGGVAEARGDLYSAPTLATSGGHAALVVASRPTLRESAIDLLPLALDGTPLGPATRLGRAPVEERAYADASVVGTSTGFLVVARDVNAPAAYVARTDATGALVASLEPIDTGGSRIDQLEVAPRPGGAVFMANTSRGGTSGILVALLDDDGRVAATWRSDASIPYVLSPALAVEGHRVFLFGAASDGVTLEIRELGCTP